MIPMPGYGLDVSVEIVRDTKTDTAKIHVHAPLYMTKHWIMGHSYKASQFTDHEILRDSDFTTVLCQHYPTLR